MLMLIEHECLNMLKVFLLSCLVSKLSWEMGPVSGNVKGRVNEEE